MAKRTKPRREAGSALPSREDIVAFVTGASGKVGKREIAKAFDVKGGDRVFLKQMLKDLENDGVIDRRGKTVHGSGALPPMVVADIIGRDRDGELVAVPAEWDRDLGGEPPKILVLMPRRTRPGLKAPGLKDRVLVRVEPVRGERDHAYTGRLVKVLDSHKAQVLGIFHAGPNGGGRIVPVEKKSREREYLVEPGHEGDAREGDLVTATALKAGRFGLPSARVRDRLGSVKSEKAVSLIALHTHGIPYIFPPDVVAEAESAKSVGMAGREDWRDLPLVTIDPPDAKDHDDAVHARPDEDPENEGGFVVTVAIADVAAYVTTGSALDREALERGNSVYFPDRVVPMLPERISNDLCSLRPHEPRPALAVRMIFDADGHKRHHSFHRVMMRSAAKLAYAQAQAAVDGHPDDVSGPLLEPVLKPLWAAYEAMARARDFREPLQLDLPERKIILKPDGTVDRVLVPERLAAHRLIEEFMIQANVAAAETLEKARSPLIYRVHDEPSLEKMRSLGEVLASIGIKLPKQGALSPALFNRILATVGGSENETFINEVILRTQAQAEYAAENYGHFGLNLRRYAHFTSPIRRYADLVVHRALIRALKLGHDGLHANVSVKELAEIGARISVAERRAMAAERETIDRLIAQFLADRVGATFTGRISGVTKAGLFIRLHETGADGFVPISTLGEDYFRFEEGRHVLIGQRTGETFRLGDDITVELVEAAPIAGALRFEVVEHQGRGKRSPGRGARGGRPVRGRDAAPTRVGKGRDKVAGRAEPALRAKTSGGHPEAPAHVEDRARSHTRGGPIRPRVKAKPEPAAGTKDTSWHPLED